METSLELGVEPGVSGSEILLQQTDRQQGRRPRLGSREGAWRPGGDRTRLERVEPGWARGRQARPAPSLRTCTAGEKPQDRMQLFLS